MQLKQNRSLQGRKGARPLPPWGKEGRGEAPKRRQAALQGAGDPRLAVAGAQGRPLLCPPVGDLPRYWKGGSPALRGPSLPVLSQNTPKVAYGGAETDRTTKLKYKNNRSTGPAPAS